VWPPTGETIYYDGESVTGVVHVHVAPGKILEHQGIQVQFVGVCCVYTATDRLTAVAHQCTVPY
jgi:hypothetical protein